MEAPALGGKVLPAGAKQHGSTTKDDSGVGACAAAVETWTTPLRPINPDEAQLVGKDGGPTNLGRHVQRALSLMCFLPDDPKTGTKDERFDRADARAAQMVMSGDPEAWRIARDLLAEARRREAIESRRADEAVDQARMKGIPSAVVESPHVAKARRTPGTRPQGSSARISRRARSPGGDEPDPPPRPRGALA
jgi:hypothetical protein